MPYDGPVQVRDWSAVLATTVAGQVTIAYRDFDLEKSPEAAREFRALGGDGVPLILVGGKAMSGFSREAFEALRRAR